MFLSFGVDVGDGQHYVAIITDAHADLLFEWFNNNPHLPESMVLQEVPTLRFPSPTNAHSAAVWVYSDINVTRSQVNNWSWGQGASLLPPVLAAAIRTVSMTVRDRPVYRCLGFQDGVPQLDLVWCTGTPANKTLIPATCVQIAAMNPVQLGNKRKASPFYKSPNCHEDDHHHDDRSSDDSAPPSPGPSRRKRRPA